MKLKYNGLVHKYLEFFLVDYIHEISLCALIFHIAMAPVYIMTIVIAVILFCIAAPIAWSICQIRSKFGQLETYYKKFCPTVTFDKPRLKEMKSN